MRIFVTGSTGYIGSAIVRALVGAGHEVGGLFRTLEKEAALKQTGAVPIFGQLRDPETYRSFAAESDAVVHCAFENPDSDRLATEELLGALAAEGGRKTFVYTSGVWVLGACSEPADETASIDRPLPIVAWRPPVERFVTSKSTDQLACAIVRPGLVYGGGQHGLFGSWVRAAEAGEEVRYVGAGTSRFAPVHVDDLAQLYRLVVEKRGRGVFHGVDDSAPTLAEAAKAVSASSKSGGRTQSWPIEEARKMLGGLADALTADQVVVAKRSRELGWTPGPSFVERYRR